MCGGGKEERRKSKKEQVREGAGDKPQTGDARAPASHRRREAKLRMPPGCSEALLSLLVTRTQPPRAPTVSLHPTTLWMAMTGHAGPEAKKPAASERRGFSREIQGPRQQWLKQHRSFFLSHI